MSLQSDIPKDAQNHGVTMAGQFSRTALLLGEESISRLSKARVAVFGVGGVGGYVCEALARSGVGSFVIVDDDVVSESNINRQIIALHSTIGMPKVDVMKARILDINPAAEVDARRCFFLPANADNFDFSEYDYVVDCVDTVAAKISIIMKAKEAGVPVISAMGAGNKLDPTRFRVADIFDTDVCPLARVIRKEMRKRGVDSLKVVYSQEKPVEYRASSEEEGVPGSTAFVPSVAGLVIAGEVVRDLSRYPD